MDGGDTDGTLTEGICGTCGTCGTEGMAGVMTWGKMTAGSAGDTMPGVGTLTP
jgi:hypothetical protein